MKKNVIFIFCVLIRSNFMLHSAQAASASPEDVTSTSIGSVVVTIRMSGIVRNSDACNMIGIVGATQNYKFTQPVSAHEVILREETTSLPLALQNEKVRLFGKHCRDIVAQNNPDVGDLTMLFTETIGRGLIYCAGIVAVKPGINDMALIRLVRTLPDATAVLIPAASPDERKASLGAKIKDILRTRNLISDTTAEKMMNLDVRAVAQDINSPKTTSVVVTPRCAARNPYDESPDDEEYVLH